MEKLDKIMEEFHLEPIAIDELSQSAHPFQTATWAYIKEKNGWKYHAYRLIINSNEKPKDLLILTKILPPIFSFAYIPFADLLDISSIPHTKLVQLLAKKIKEKLHLNLLFLRYDFPFTFTDEKEIVHIKGRRLRECKDSVQPEATNIIDLTGGYENVKEQYRQRAKRAMRRSENDEVTIVEYNQKRELFDQWYTMYSITAKRDGFSTRSKEYISSLLHDKKTKQHTDLILAMYNKKVVGGAITISSDNYVVYLFGASIRIQGITPSYLLQDYSIQKACRDKKQYYDLHGISGPGKKGGNLESLTLFKQSFGGKRYYRPPSTDYVYIPIIHAIYTFLENVRYALIRKSKPTVNKQQYGISQDN